MAGRRCPASGCPKILTHGERYCPEHSRDRERARGTTAERGYGAEHRRKRAAIVARIEAGDVVRCIDCGVKLTAQTLDLGHTDDRMAYRGPQCATCNRSDGGRRAHK